MGFYLKHNSFCSKYLGMKCGIIEPIIENQKSSAFELDQLVKKSFETGYKFLSLRFDPSNIDLYAAATSCDFVFVECLLTFSMDLDDGYQWPSTKFDDYLASLDDIEAISQIAHDSFKFDRFHLDPLIDDSCADKLKAAWSKNCVCGRSDKVFVVRAADEKVIGFNACKLTADAVVIDLIAVDGRSQKNGVATQLLRMCVQEYRGRKNRLLVGTQANNKASINLYLKHGLSLNSVQYTFHRHSNVKVNEKHNFEKEE